MKKHHILPTGCHDADSAAKVLGVTKLQLLAFMREIGWLYAGGDMHNLPRQELKRKGILTTQERGYCLKGKREIGKTYSVMLLTQLGFQELKKLMKTTEASAKTEHEKPQILAKEPLQKTEETEKPYDKVSADAAHEKFLDDLRNLGIAS